MPGPLLDSTLRVDHLVLKNFRCFEYCQAALHPHLTVLVAENGGGKTAILDAAAIALGRLVDRISNARRRSTSLVQADARLAASSNGAMKPQLPVVIGASGQVEGLQISWEVALPRVGKGARMTSRKAAPLMAAGLALRGRLESHAAGVREQAPPLPLVAFYGTGRLWGDRRMTSARRRSDPSIVGRLTGYLDCLSPSSSYKAFEAWFRRTRDEAQHGSAIASHPDRHPALLLTAVTEAVRTVLEPTGWHTLDMDGHRLAAEHPTQGRLPLSSLSDGVRNMIALVGDIAHRCVRLNPHFRGQAARLTPGVLLIDEVDMHLHPRWQQLVVGLLQTAFPAMQMLLTTHSPQVLSTVPRECIRIIERNPETGWVVRTPEEQTEGVASAHVMASVMGVDSTPDNVHVRRLREYGSLIASGHVDREDARTLRASLDAHFGPQSAVMLECDRVIRLEDMKRRMLKREGA